MSSSYTHNIKKDTFQKQCKVLLKVKQKHKPILVGNALCVHAHDMKTTLLPPLVSNCAQLSEH